MTAAVSPPAMEAPWQRPLEHQAAPLGGLTLPIGRSRCEEKATGLSLPGIGAAGGGLPGVFRRGEPEWPEAVKWVTETATTPLHRDVSGGRPQRSWSNCSQGNVAALPKWARKGSSGSFGSLGGTFDNPETPSSSAASSLTGPTRFDSGMSLNWSPEKTLVQSWHRKLSETYADYNMVNMVGSGRAGAVFIVQHRRSERYYACKMLNKLDQQAEAMRREVAALRRLDHPNVVRLYETLEDRESLCLLMELCSGGDLHSRIAEERRLPERLACVFAEQLLSALAYCHSMGVVHRDVKPENVLLETEDADCERIKLADFGIAAFVRPVRRSSSGLSACEGEALGSLPYMAPELLMREHSAGNEAAADLWSCGVVIYLMITGVLPFGDSATRICRDAPPSFSADVWRGGFKAEEVVRGLLTREVSQRWSAQQARRHAWFQGLAAREDRQAECLEERSELARQLLKSLKRWRRLPQLKRIAIAAVAKRLEAEHPALRLASAAFRAFNPGGDRLRCDHLVQQIDAALQGVDPPSPSAEGTSPSKDKTLTGLHMRQNLKAMVKRLSRLSEETPTGGSPSGALSPVPGLFSDEEEDLASLTELRVLVDKLDGEKDGCVDYTLLAAALLPREAYQDGRRLEEAFDAFDLRRRGLVGAEELQAALGAKGRDLKHFAELVRPVGARGELDRAAFRAMMMREDWEHFAQASP